MQLYKDLAQLFMATEASPLRVDSVEFWIDSDALVYSIPTAQWNPRAMGEAVASLARVYPEVGRIVMRYA
jgi:hypothetical protein